MTSGHTLLIVEDDPAHAELIELGFRRSNWSLLTRTSLQSAQAELAAGAVDVVLADLNLPDGDAMQLCDAGLPVVIMTSHGDEDRAVAALRAGALNYVVKTPQSLRAMPSVVTQALREWLLIQARQDAEEDAQRKSAELERNNQRLRAVLKQVTDLPRIETSRGVLELIGGIVSEQLLARHDIDDSPPGASRPAPTPGIRIRSGFEVEVPLPTASNAPGFVLRLSRPGHDFDGSELTLIELVAELAREKVRELEARRELAESQRQLHQDDKMRLVGQLAGGIAHDFNNMLGTIVGAASVLQVDLEKGDPELKEQVALILDVGEHAARLTRRLLTFARGGSIVRETVRVADVLAQLVSMLHHSLPDTIAVHADVAGDPQVLCDPSLLQTALLNLCINARDAMPDGGSLTLEARVQHLDGEGEGAHSRAMPPGSYVEFLVRDDGAGMDKTTLARAFEPFFSTKDSLNGSGLGLPVVLGMFQDGGGSVRVESEPGGGTSVFGYLPAATKAVRDAPTDAPTVTECAPLSVLVVDDNEGMLKTTKRLLERAGHSVVCTALPQRALEMALHEPFDLLLVDVAMPQMDGVELVRRLFDAGVDSRVLYTSGYSPDRAGLETMAADPRVSFLSKPFNRNQLVRAVQTAWTTIPERMPKDTDA